MDSSITKSVKKSTNEKTKHGETPNRREGETRKMNAIEYTHSGGTFRAPFIRDGKFRYNNIDKRCSTTVKTWINEQLRTKYKDPNDIRKVQEEFPVLRSGEIKHIWFERFMKSKDDKMNLPCACFVSQNQVTKLANEDAIAIFCLEHLEDESDDEDEEKDKECDKVIKKGKMCELNGINVQPKTEKLILQEDGRPVQIRGIPPFPTLYLLGFIMPDSPVLTMGTIIKAGTRNIYEKNFLTDTILFKSTRLTLDVIGLLRCIKRSKTSLDDAMSLLSFGQDENANKKKKDKKPEDSYEDLFKTNRLLPSMYIYVYNWDPPKQASKDDNYVMANIDFEQEVLHRLKTLVDVEKETSYGNSTRQEYQLSQLPISNKTQRARDRICMHFLIPVIATCSDQVIEWYIRAESILLENNLTSLLDMDDRILTLKENGFDLKSIMKKGTITWMDSFESHLCSVQEQRIRLAIRYAKEYVRKCQKKCRRLMDEESEQTKETMKASDELEDLQKGFELIEKCKKYIDETVEIEQEENINDED